MTAVAFNVDWGFAVIKCAMVTLPLVAMRLAVVTRDAELEKVIGQAVLDAMNAAHLSVKEIAPLMGVDEANLRSMLRGDGRYHLGIAHLAKLPFAFWTWFGPSLFALLAKRNLDALAEAAEWRRSA